MLIPVYILLSLTVVITGIKVLFFLLLILIAGLAGRALYEPCQLEITHPRLVARPDSRPPAAAGAASADALSARLKVVLLTDLHAEWLRIRPEALAKAIRQASADVVLFGGAKFPRGPGAALAACCAGCGQGLWDSLLRGSRQP
jgi:hypothetical protein